MVEGRRVGEGDAILVERRPIYREGRQCRGSARYQEFIWQIKTGLPVENVPETTGAETRRKICPTAGVAEVVAWKTGKEWGRKFAEQHGNSSRTVVGEQRVYGQLSSVTSPRASGHAKSLLACVYTAQLNTQRERYTHAHVRTQANT